ncbi:hypothetical protein [Streptomyces sp. ME19-01-6]|uniref:hypothetical protein n=1 Tax=Streptomyces sp. ME19-01-6 TaxID=3028686 RepID=UPI0029B7D6E2|nr:hypothetical protein [Streptomyces sp. ME19-01-6]MDX3230549.1 hypothetical protein [Streptomyces sp. ME19-01-6]
MTDHPYTNDDLRAEAARQHKTLTEDPDFMGIGEQMEDGIVPSTREAGAPRSWDSVLRLNADDYDEFEKAQRKIHDLIDGAADVSEWAINLGADGLQPISGNLNIKDSHGDDRVRLHLAFAPDMDQDTRKAVIERIADAIRYHS